MKTGEMNAERLLALYERVADAPDAIARLRQFVLALAVRGKLVKQDSNDEPASDLLRWISEKRAAIRKTKKSPSSALEPVPFNGELYGLPPGWVWTSLASVSDVTMGQSPPGSTYNTSGDGVPLINGPVEFTLGPFGKTVVNQYTTAPTNFCEQGDLLICVRGSTTGRTNIADFKACIGRGVAAIRSSFEDDFIRLFLWKSREDIISMGRGIAFPSISKKQLESLAVPLPPLAEQHRIVAKVDELMALLDRLDATRTAAESTRDRLTAASFTRLTAPNTAPEAFPAHARFALDALPALTKRPDQIKSLRQTILNLAVRGKLVKQDPNDEPASELLKRIAAEKARLMNIGEIRQQKLPAPVLPQERPFSAPMGWTWARLIEIGLTQTGTSPSSSKPDLFGDFIPFVKPADLDGATIHYDGQGLSREGVNHSRVAAANTVMMVCIGATLGKVNVTDRDVCFNQQINSLTPYVDGMHGFVALALKSSDFQKGAWARAGTGTLPIISKGKWELLAIPLPPLAEQHRIVTKVDALMALCDQLETALATSDTTKQRLLNALLHEALAQASRNREAA